MTARRAFRIAYDGRSFHGFQRQPEVATVSDAILDALRSLDVIDETVPDWYAAAGRTDAGVSALAQTVTIEGPAWLSPAALNSELPAAVRAWASADVPADFHATHDAVEREYTYHLHAPSASLSRAKGALSALSGEHDFHNFTPDATGTVRDLTGDVERDGDFLVVAVRSDGFPRQFVRRLLTVLKVVARGVAGRERIEHLLDSDPLDGPDGVAPAPPEPLVLTDVIYPDIAFERDPDAVESARDVFDGRAIDHRTNARVGSAIADGIDD
ncbi:tRNA pseudouridine(38-40) synthase TruA [Halorhabdus sp. CUG00001]|uniref:tRNA pseudouridine(38-40) synthase TruA n=1 Tax=Halorhabdus sp. CUG00001 TaxID=2600297 RepID=UPI00131B09B8|nr:tRNA pseudouridine(38-40) synthase TruA [Halorhabdus sp. CUG00001]